MKLIREDEEKLSEPSAGGRVFFFAGLISWREGTRHGAQRRGGQTEGGLLLPTFLGRARKVGRLPGATGKYSIKGLNQNPGVASPDDALLFLLAQKE